jgi:hypothetical protein
LAENNFSNFEQNNLVMESHHLVMETHNSLMKTRNHLWKPFFSPKLVSSNGKLIALIFLLIFLVILTYLKTQSDEPFSEAEI